MMTSLYALSDVNVPHLWETSAEMVDYLTAPLSPADLLHHLWVTDPQDPYFAGIEPNLVTIERHPELAEGEPDYWAAAERATAFLQGRDGLPSGWSGELRAIASSTPASWSPTQRAIAVRAAALVAQRELSEQWLRDVFSSEFFATAVRPQPLT